MVGAGGEGVVAMGVGGAGDGMDDCGACCIGGGEGLANEKVGGGKLAGEGCVACPNAAVTVGWRFEG